MKKERKYKLPPRMTKSCVYGYLVKIDKGHKFICPKCLARWNDDKNLIGRERDIELVYCCKCRG